MTGRSTEITLAMLRFLRPAGARRSPPPWHVWPLGRRLDDAELAAALAAMPKPVAVSAHLEPWGVTVTPLADCAPEGREWAEREWRNQAEFLRMQLGALAPAGAATCVLLELDGETHVYTAAELAAWAEAYVVPSCAWTLQPCEDERAPVRLLLVRPDGTRSPGSACRPRGPGDHAA